MKFQSTLTESVLDIISLAREEVGSPGTAKVSEFIPDISLLYLLDYTEDEILDKIKLVDEVENICIDDLIPGQNGLNKKRLYDIYQKIKMGEDLGPIIVIAYKGRNYLWDGHHRAAAYNIIGKKVIPARVLRL